MGESSRVPIVLPLKGVNTVNPFVDAASGYARELTNYSIVNGRIVMRPAILIDIQSASTGQVVWMDINTVGVQAILKNGDIRKLSDNTGATSIGGAALYNATRVKHSSLDLIFGLLQPRLAASPFTAWTFTTTVTDTTIRCGCSHKGRLYVFTANQMEYSTIGAITGAMDGTLSLTELLGGQSIVRAFSVTMNPGSEVSNVLAVFADGGRVLVFGGDYPKSSSWSLLAQFDMPAPVSNIGFVEIDGDIFVATKLYAYWFRDLISGGAQTAYDNSPSLPVENLWQAVGWYGSNALPGVSHSYYIQKHDCIVTQSTDNTGTDLYGTGGISGVSGPGGSPGTRFVYFRKYKAWAIWLGTNFYAPVIYDSTNAILYGTHSPVPAAGDQAVQVRKLSFTQIRDEYSSSTTFDVESTWKTPYITAFDGVGHKLEGMRIWFENTVSGYLEKIRAIFDFSDYNAPYGFYTQSSATAINPAVYTDTAVDYPAVTSNQYNPNAGVTGMGGAFSIQVTQKRKSGASVTQSQSVYAATVLAEEGGPQF